MTLDMNLQVAMTFFFSLIAKNHNQIRICPIEGYKVSNLEKERKKQKISKLEHRTKTSNINTLHKSKLSTLLHIVMQKVLC